MNFVPGKNKYFLPVLALTLAAGLFAFRSAGATISTLRGAAWYGSQYKYVYFDCLDDITGDRLDVTGNITTPPGFRFYTTPCTSIVHHSAILTNNNLTGDAWNSVLGYISLDGTATPPDGGASINSICPTTCNPSNDCWACYNPADQKIYGWGRVDASGEWIKFNSATTTPVKNQGWDYLGNSVLPGHNIQPGDFVGDASSNLGYLSFNCESELGGAGNCGLRDYKVYISNLQIGHLSAPNWGFLEACSGGALKAVLKWDLRSGEQDGYEVVVNDSPSFATSSGDYLCWSGVKTPAVASQYIIPNTDPNCQALDYNSNYYWWVRLYDLIDGEYVPTEWYKFGGVDGHNGLTDGQTDGNPDNNIQTFSTYLHEFTSPFFTWTPYDILVATSTEFEALTGSRYFSSATPALPQSCFGNNCRFLWSTNDPLAIISNPTGATTSMTFFSATGTTVSLRLTDPDDYVCTMSTVIRINYGLPIWREVKAE